MSWPGSHTRERSLLGLGILAILFLIVSKIFISRKKMSSPSSHGYDIFKYLVKLGFQPGTAMLITAQAAHETGNFTSDIFNYNNNPFGMKFPKVRETTAIGQARGFAVYDDIQTAVADYWLYYHNQKYPLTWNNADQFIEALKDKGYFEDRIETYKKAVKKYLSVYFNA